MSESDGHCTYHISNKSNYNLRMPTPAANASSNNNANVIANRATLTLTEPATLIAIGLSVVSKKKVHGS